MVLVAIPSDGTSRASSPHHSPTPVHVHKGRCGVDGLLTRTDNIACVCVDAFFFRHVLHQLFVILTLCQVRFSFVCVCVVHASSLIHSLVHGLTHPLSTVLSSRARTDTHAHSIMLLAACIRASFCSNRESNSVPMSMTQLSVVGGGGGGGEPCVWA